MGLFGCVYFSMSKTLVWIDKFIQPKLKYLMVYLEIRFYTSYIGKVIKLF